MNWKPKLEGRLFFFFNERACAGFNADEKEPVKREVVDGGWSPEAR